VNDDSSEDKEVPARVKNTALDNYSTGKKTPISSTKLDGTDSVRNDNSYSEDKIKSDTKPPHIKIIPPDSESKTTKKTKTTATSEEDVSPPTNDNNKPKDKNNPDTELSDSYNGFNLKEKRTKSDTKDSTSDDVGSKDNGDLSTKSSDHRARNSGSSAVASDNGSREEKKSTATNDDSNSKKGKSSHTDDGSQSFSSSSDLASSIRNKVNSIIRNSLGGIGHNLFGFSDNGGF
jgi:hypothetical protein